MKNTRTEDVRSKAVDPALIAHNENPAAIRARPMKPKPSRTYPVAALGSISGWSICNGVRSMCRISQSSALFSHGCVANSSAGGKMKSIVVKPMGSMSAGGESRTRLEKRSLWSSLSTTMSTRTRPGSRPSKRKAPFASVWFSSDTHRSKSSSNHCTMTLASAKPCPDSSATVPRKVAVLSGAVCASRYTNSSGRTNPSSGVA